MVHPKVDIVDLSQLEANSNSTSIPPPLANQIISSFRVPQGPPTENNNAISSSAENYVRKRLYTQWKSKHGGSTASTAQENELDFTRVCRYNLPTHLLYDTKGLQLFDAITKLPGDTYYLTSKETQILKRKSHRLAKDLLEGLAEPDQGKMILLELGCGSMIKTKLILDALEHYCATNTNFNQIQIEFYALDLDFQELLSSLTTLSSSQPSNGFTNGTRHAWKHVSFHGLWGNYDQAMQWLQTSQASLGALGRAVLWLGSSIGNLSRTQASQFLISLRNCLKPNDKLLLGIDNCTDAEMVELAYNDPAGVTKEFELNSLHHVNALLKPLNYDEFPFDKFDYVGGYNPKMRRHEAYLQVQSTFDLVLQPRKELEMEMPIKIEFQQGELIHIEYSVKYDMQDIDTLLRESNWGLKSHFREDTTYSFLVLTPAKFNIRRNAPGMELSQQGNLSHLPSIKEWEELWQICDCIFHQLVLREALENTQLRPIDLRLPLIFYLGHSPCFTDRILSRISSGNKLTEPVEFQDIFARGIDPNMSDPTQCHSHSRIPEVWPQVHEIQGYRDQVRQRVRRVTNEFGSLSREEKIQLGEALNMAFGEYFKFSSRVIVFHYIASFPQQIRHLTQSFPSQ
jgi:EasF-like predicted methyltransferase